MFVITKIKLSVPTSNFLFYTGLPSQNIHTVHVYVMYNITSWSAAYETHLRKSMCYIRR